MVVKVTWRLMVACSPGKPGLVNEIPEFRCHTPLAAGTDECGVTWTSWGIWPWEALSFQTHWDGWFPKELHLSHANRSSVLGRNRAECAVAIAGAGESMETPERGLYVSSKHHSQRQYQGTYEAGCEARIISIHLAKCSQSSLQSK